MPVLDARSSRDDFPGFPYQPYSIQQDFMREVYQALSSGSIGLFESPTGTSLKPRELLEQRACRA